MNAVDNVSSDIGSGDEEDKDKKDSTTLTGAITDLGDTTKNIVGSSDEKENIFKNIKIG